MTFLLLSFSLFHFFRQAVKGDTYVVPFARYDLAMLKYRMQVRSSQPIETSLCFLSSLSFYFGLLKPGLTLLTILPSVHD